MTREKLLHLALVFSSEDCVGQLARDSLDGTWLINTFPALDVVDEVRALLVRPGLGIVVVDDKGIEDNARGWLLDQVRKWAPQALVAYIANEHSAEIERRARSRNVHYYCSRPLDRDRTVSVLRSFA